MNVLNAIFVEEARRAGAPLPFVTLSTVGPALMSHGSEEHKAKFLPGILSGELHFAIGYSEPEAGTDLASLKTEAVRDARARLVAATRRVLRNGLRILGVEALERM